MERSQFYQNVVNLNYQTLTYPNTNMMQNTMRSHSPTNSTSQSSVSNSQTLPSNYYPTHQSIYQPPQPHQLLNSPMHNQQQQTAAANYYNLSTQNGGILASSSSSSATGCVGDPHYSSYNTLQFTNSINHHGGNNGNHNNNNNNGANLDYHQYSMRKQQPSEF
jgi:hypothetical protein